MKNNIYYLFAALLFLGSCGTIEDRNSLGPVASPDQIKLAAVSTTTVHGKKGNQIAVVNNTPQFGGQWNLLVKRSINNQDTVVLPFLGNVTLYFLATSGGGLVRDSTQTVIDTLDHPVDPTYSILAGSTPAGKTWVWATDKPGTPKGPWGNGGYLSDTYPIWWGIGVSPQPSVMNDQMIFDLNGAANFTLVTGNTQNVGLPAGTHHGSFSFDLSKGKKKSDGTVWSIGTITFTGATVSQGFSPNEGSAGARPLVYTFDIIKLTEDELDLCYNTPGDGEGWFWLFKRMGFSF